MSTEAIRTRETTPNRHYAPAMRPAGTITLRWLQESPYTTVGETTIETLYRERIHGARVIGWGEGMLPCWSSPHAASPRSSRSTRRTDP